MQEISPLVNYNSFQKSFDKLMDISASVRKLCSWADSDIEYIHLKEKFPAVIKTYELQRMVCRLELMKIEGDINDTEKVSNLRKVLNDADAKLNELLEDIYQLSNNKLFDYKLKELSS